MTIGPASLSDDRWLRTLLRSAVVGIAAFAISVAAAPASRAVVCIGLCARYSSRRACCPASVGSVEAVVESRSARRQGGNKRKDAEGCMDKIIDVRGRPEESSWVILISTGENVS